MNKYSILIPIHNEFFYVQNLLDFLKPYGQKGHEIIIIDDGSKDGSSAILENNKLINLITLKENQGKGSALKEGLKIARYDKIIIFDGDMELNPLDIENMMILDKKSNIRYTMGYRFNSLNPLRSNFDWGNFMFTSFFNILFNSKHKDILCCAKSFYLDDIKIYKLLSNGFDIDVELSSILTIRNKYKKIPQILLNYKRRTTKEGKKLQISDGWNILSRIIRMIAHF